MASLFEPNPKLADRIGDYVLICKENYLIKDTLKNEEEKIPHPGHHGGVSKEEMLVSMVVGLYRENLQLQKDFLDGVSLRGPARIDYEPCGAVGVRDEH